jgi:hypothetical protein
MDCEAIVRALLDDAGGAFICSPSGRPGVVLLGTPLLYHMVQVTVESLEDGGVRVTDGALTMMRLDFEGAPVGGPAHHARALALARSYGLYLDDGALGIRSTAEQLAGAVWRVASAAVQLDAVSHEDVPTRSESFARKVEGWLEARTPYPTVKRPELPGTDLQVDLMIETTVPLYVQAATGTTRGERIKSIRSASWTFRMAGTIRPAQRLLVAKDPIEGLSSPELREITDVATLATWNRRDELLEYLDLAQRDKLPMQGMLLTPAAPTF